MQGGGYSSGTSAGAGMAAGMLTSYLINRYTNAPEGVGSIAGATVGGGVAGGMGGVGGAAAGSAGAIGGGAIMGGSGGVIAYVAAQIISKHVFGVGKQSGQDKASQQFYGSYQGSSEKRLAQQSGYANKSDAMAQPYKWMTQEGREYRQDIECRDENDLQ